MTSTGLICLYLRVQFCGRDMFLLRCSQSCMYHKHESQKARNYSWERHIEIPLFRSYNQHTKGVVCSFFLFLYFGMGCWWSSGGNIMCSRITSTGISPPKSSGVES